MTNDKLFRTIHEHHGDGPWGTVLDAGTGTHSLTWISGLPCTRWTAVTAEPDRGAELRGLFAETEPPGEVVIGSWEDPALLSDQRFDVVVADYLLGAVEMCSPYFQGEMFGRLRPHVDGVLYVVGLEPFPKFADSPGRELIQQIIALRDACFLLAGERPYREYPAQWVCAQLDRAGFDVELHRTFTNVYGDPFVRTQLNVASAQLAYVPAPRLKMALQSHIEALGERASAHAELQDGVRWGNDYVIAAKPRSG